MSKPFEIMMVISILAVAWNVVALILHLLGFDIPAIDPVIVR